MTFDDNPISDKQKEAAAIMVMQRIVEKLAEKESVTIDEALQCFSQSMVYDALFDFETRLWAEGPDYILGLFSSQGLGEKVKRLMDEGVKK